VINGLNQSKNKTDHECVIVKDRPTKNIEKAEKHKMTAICNRALKRSTMNKVLGCLPQWVGQIKSFYPAFYHQDIKRYSTW